MSEFLINFLIRCAEEKRVLFKFNVELSIKGSNEKESKDYLLLPSQFITWVNYTRKNNNQFDWHSVLTAIAMIDPIDAAEYIQQKKEEAIKEVDKKIFIYEQHKAKIIEPFDEKLKDIETYCRERKKDETE